MSPLTVDDDECQVDKAVCLDCLQKSTPPPPENVKSEPPAAEEKAS